jgi:hypothetical protein
VAFRGDAQTRYYRIADDMVETIFRALCDVCEARPGEGGAKVRASGTGGGEADD